MAFRMSNDKKETILVFGGNGFIGAETVDYLLNNNPNYEFVLLNRGNWKDFDSATRIRPRIKENIIFDRKKHSLKECLKDYLTRPNFKFRAVLDFSAYKSSDIRNVLAADLPAHIIDGLYVYISSDSVYEVCIDKKLKEPDGSVCLNETDSIRPESKEEREKLKEFDSYAHHKLKAEEKLTELAQSNGFNFLIIRLPDVIGPRDSLIRFWLHQMWLQFIDWTADSPDKVHRVPIQKHLFDKKTSYVYVGDVARFIHLALLNEFAARNQVVNVGFEIGLSIQEFISLMARHVRNGLEKSLEFYSVDHYEKAMDFDYPSVTKGMIDVRKMRDHFKFEPSNWDQVMQSTIDFYNEAYAKFPADREIVEKHLMKKFLKKSGHTKDDVEKFIKERLKY